MSKSIRNKRNNFTLPTRTPGMIFLCEIPKNEIFTYPGSRAYVKTGIETKDNFQAICIACSKWNPESLGRKEWLSKKGFSKSRAIGDKLWSRHLKVLKAENAPEIDYYVRTEKFTLWLSATDLRLNNPHEKTYGYEYHDYDSAFVASKINKQLFIEQNKLIRAHTTKR